MTDQGFAARMAAAHRSTKTPGNSLKDAISRLDPTRIAQVTKIFDSCPPIARNRYIRSVQGRGGSKSAVRTMCYHCTGWDRKEAALCTARGCPLWAYNPWRVKKPTAMEKEGAPDA